MKKVLYIAQSMMAVQALAVAKASGENVIMQNPEYSNFSKPPLDGVDGVLIVGDYPDIAKCFEEAEIDVQVLSVEEAGKNFEEGYNQLRRQTGDDVDVSMANALKETKEEMSARLAGLSKGDLVAEATGLGLTTKSSDTADVLREAIVDHVFKEG